MVLDWAVAAGIFPAAAAEVGADERPLWQGAFGTLTLDPPVPTTLETTFDLASLTKVIATTTVIMQLVAADQLKLAEPVAAFFDEWRGSDRFSVMVRDLLEHASGLPARLVDPPPATRREFEHDVCTIALEYPPRSQSIYSDLGFILLGFLAEQRGHASLQSQFGEIMRRLDVHAMSGMTFDVQDRRNVAPTAAMEDDIRRGRLLVGEVHDNYAAALGGVAGHAGLFGSVQAVGQFARVMLRAARGERWLPSPFAPAIVDRFLTKSEVDGSSRALGWDKMLPTSSCGSHMSPSAFGHVGYTGTSLWIDPQRNRYFVLLTNRACGGGTVDEMRTVRRAFHDALRDI
jgi:CubicO group peptidase (beta-lactamase class C family)